MLINEAAILATYLDQIQPKSILDIGSDNRVGREIIQPHIHAAFRGHDVIFTDLAPAPGLIQCDVTDKATLVDLPRCDVVTCCSMLEHVTDVEGAIDNVCSLVDKWLIVSAPLNYPEHHCPIDNGWRPTPGELGDKFAARGLTVVEVLQTPPENFYGVAGASVSMVLARRDAGEAPC
jgi:hypothetical protein